MAGSNRLHESVLRRMTSYAGDAAFEALAAPLEGRSVRLVPLSERHLGEMDHAFRSDAGLWTWMLTAEPRRQLETVDWFERAFRGRIARTQAPFAIELLDGTLAGTTSFMDIRPYDGGVEIGTTLVFKRHRRTSVNTEAKLLLIGRAFACDYVRVAFKTDTRNARSRSAIERLGATFEGVLRSYQRRHDETVRDTALYSILVNEWSTVQERLEMMLARSADASAAR
jgi:RimJ/RimL family protein N-acetyltransferase